MNRTRTPAPIRLFAIVLLSCSSAFAALPAAVPAEWSGTIGAVSGDDLALVGVADRFRLAGSVTERQSGRTLSTGDLAPGSSVTLRVGDREADGRFRVDGVMVQAKNPLVLAGQIERVSDDRRHIEVHGTEIEVDDHTTFSGRGDSGTVRSARDLRAGMTVRATLVATASGVLKTSDVRAISAPAEFGEDQEIRGTVAAISDTSWTIDARVFAVNDQTEFRGDPGAGDTVEVKFHVGADGGVVAERIAKEDEAPGSEIEFMGIVEAIGDAAWTVSGRVIGIDSQTRIVGSPVVGDNVEVQAHRAPDGALTASKIQKEDAVEQEVEFTGIVESIGDTVWIVDGKSVLVNAATDIQGFPAAGDTVEVRALGDSQGVLTATRIKKEDPSGGGDDHGSGSGNGDPGDNQGGDGHGGHPGGDEPSGHN